VKAAPRKLRHPKDIRAEAIALARSYARQRDHDGDPEGAAVIRDLASELARIRLTSLCSANA
jgi:hypothetical protein